MLTEFQEYIARLISTNSPDTELALAGGAALISLRLVERGTVDLDFFTPLGSVEETAGALIEALEAAGVRVAPLQRTPTFARLRVGDEAESCIVDVAQDFRLRPAQLGPLGLTLAADELAADKTLTVFSRARGRDFLDVYHLARRYDKERLLELAAEKDLGFDRAVIAHMLLTIDRLDRDEFECDDATFRDLKRFFEEWRAELTAT